MHRRRVAVAVLAVAALGLSALTLSAGAATPSSGHISRAKPLLKWKTAQQVGSPIGPFIGFAGLLECPPAELDPKDAVCDHFTLTVDTPASWWEHNHGGVSITVPGDFYGFVYKGNNLVSYADWTGEEANQMTIASASGTYEVRLAPYVAFGVYDVTAHWLSKPGKDGGFPELGFTAYHGKTFSSLPRTRPMNAELTSYRGPVAKWRPAYVGEDAVEPTMGVDRSGRATFVAFRTGVGKQQSWLMHSSYDNRNWRSIQPNVAGQDTHPASLDPYVYVDKDYGRIFDIDLAAAGSYVDFSDDQGDNWVRGAAVSPFGVNDHQTLFAAKPPAESSLLATLDPRFPKLVYYCVNQVDGTFCSISHDGGLTYVPGGSPVFPPARVDDAAGLNASVCGGLTGQGVGDSKGRVFMPRGNCGVPELSYSYDGGQTWTVVDVAKGVSAAGFQTAVAVDSKDNVYYVWWDAKFRQPWLAISRDHGQTWSKPRMIAPPGVAAVNFPSIDAGSPGRVAIAFPGTEVADASDLTRPWSSYVVMSTDALSSNPTFLSSVVNPGGLDDPIHRGDCFNRCGNMFDFLDVVVAPDYKGTVWVAAVDTCTKEDSCSTSRVGGYSSKTKGNGAASSSRGVAVMQTSGPPLRVSGG